MMDGWMDGYSVLLYLWTRYGYRMRGKQWMPSDLVRVTVTVIDTTVMMTVSRLYMSLSIRRYTRISLINLEDLYSMDCTDS
jgi:hypothetical protein